MEDGRSFHGEEILTIMSNYNFDCSILHFNPLQFNSYILFLIYTTLNNREIKSYSI